MRALFLGGDIRQKYACEYLLKNGIESDVFCDFILDDTIINKIKNTDVIIFPLPSVKEEIYLNMKAENKLNIYDIIEFIDVKHIVLGGMINESILASLSSKSAMVFDYYEDETFKIYNAFLSAEGAVFYAKKRMDRSIHGASIAVMGYGRIGKILSHLLNAQGAHVSVFTRKELDRVWGSLAGFRANSIASLSKEDKKTVGLCECDVIFNTIPAHIFDDMILSHLKPNTLIIDVSSYPFGVSDDILSKYELKYFRESGIPGRYAPQSAGEALGKTIINFLERSKSV